MRLSSLAAVSVLALGLAAPALAQDAATIRRAEAIRDAALNENIALDYVTQLTTRFGARPAGSKAEQDASAWAAGYMRAHGFQNVRIEEFPLVGWERGEESAAIVGAHPQRLVVAALGHSPGTNGALEAEVARFDSLEALNAAPAGSLAGKIAYVDAGQMVRMQDGSGYGPLSRIRSAGPAAAASKGAIAFIMRSAGSDEHRMPHTGTTRYVDGVVPLPGFALAAP
ncbi:MAG: M20/M25/M40 family metallo-hydrolase, partial [Brevundimonas sp.]